MKLISVIIPIYNIDAYLFQCVQSVLSQTYKNIEIILINDGSTDNSGAICEYFRKSDNRVKVVNQINSGLVRARKAGIEICKGDFIYNLDGDDWIEQDCIETMLNHMQSNDVDIVIGGHHRDFIGSSENIKNNIPSGFYDINALSDCVYDRIISFGDFFQHGINTYSWGKLIKRQLAIESQMAIPDDIVMGEDAAFVYPLLFRVNSIYITDYCGYNYRQRPSSILKKIASDNVELENLSRLFNYLHNRIVTNRPSNLSLQLSQYFFALSLIRTGGFFDNPEYFRYFNPFGNITDGARICLYSSGSFGQHIYNKLQKSEKYKIVGWFDDDFAESRLVGLDVSDPADIVTTDYDYVLIATVDSAKAKLISERLKEIGLLDRTIRSIRVNNHNIEPFIEKLGYSPVNYKKIIKAV